ncbi:hypothetical protein C0992_007483 [Termitomyces sp. T32_za158]|nr:hypothetical protein C0992_007483 [Termitomyces sp. T32_za158]
MAPLIPVNLLEKRSTNGSNDAIIISAVVGGVFVTTAVIVLYVILTRRASRASSNHQHTRNLSNTSAPLLKSKSHHGTELVAPPLKHFHPPSDNIHYKIVTHSPSTSRPYQYGEVEPRSRVAMSVISSRLPAAKPSLSSLSIPSQSPQIPTINIPPSPTSSESLYSQPSASTYRILTTHRERKTPSPSLLPPMVPQYAYIRPETADLSRTYEHDIGKMLKERAKRNARKSTRDVSMIEHAGSVESASDSETSDEESEFVRRPRRFQSRSSVNVLVP